MRADWVPLRTVPLGPIHGPDTDRDEITDPFQDESLLLASRGGPDSRAGTVEDAR